MPVPRPQLRTIEGQGRGVKPRKQQAPWVRTAVVMSAVVCIALATASVARVTITNATVQMMQSAEQTSAAINYARMGGVGLEVDLSLASNPTRIQDRAADFGVYPTSRVNTISALNGFSQDTMEQMDAAAQEARALELQVLLEHQEPPSQPAAPKEQGDALKPAATIGILQAAPSTT